MAGRPRGEVIDESRVGVYHVWMRCVRKMFLCGFDRYSKRDYSYRKEWFTERLAELSSIFAVDACVWAILSNHYHLIVRNRPDLVAQWSDEEVVRRWWYLCPERREKCGRPAPPTDLELRSMLSDGERVAELRKRLSSISWFMKSLNEWFSKRANAEDHVRGHFWDGRFGCRNLVSEGAILVCSIYIDVNEIRAHLASQPEHSRHTSAYVRILARILRRQRAEAKRATEGCELFQTEYRPGDPDYWMCPLHTQDRAPLLGVPGTSAAASSACPADLWEQDGGSAAKQWRHGFLSVSLDEYLQVLDRTVQQITAGRTDGIDEELAPILERLGIQPKVWLTLLAEFETWFHGAVGKAEQVMELAAATGRRWIQGIQRCREGFA